MASSEVRATNIVVPSWRITPNHRGIPQNRVTLLLKLVGLSRQKAWMCWAHGKITRETSCWLSFFQFINSNWPNSRMKHKCRSSGIEIPRITEGKQYLNQRLQLNSMTWIWSCASHRFGCIRTGSTWTLEHPNAPMMEPKARPEFSRAKPKAEQRLKESSKVHGSCSWFFLPLDPNSKS